MKRINVTQLKELQENNNVILIDVREKSEFEEMRIEGSIFLPLSEITSEKLTEIITDTNKEIVFQCAGGVRSETAIKKCLDCENSSSFSNLEGGISAWVNSGYPIES